MNPNFTLYFSRIIGNKVLAKDNEPLGKLRDLVVDTSMKRPQVIAAVIQTEQTNLVVDFSSFSITKENGQYRIVCRQLKEIEIETESERNLFLQKYVIDKQIVDMFGRKVVRVNDLRFVVLSTGAYLLAVDVGMEGLLRRIGIAKPIQKVLKLFNLNIPGKLILWDDVETFNYSSLDLQLSRPYTKLRTMHPSDIADIIEDLDRKTQVAVFSSLDEEQAADVLEELEEDVQTQLITNLSKEKAADVLEKMPADEVADILEELEEDKAEELLLEMESTASREVRELMEYEDNEAGSIMSTDFYCFNENDTVDEVISQLRSLKPETNHIYCLFVLNDRDKLTGTLNLRDVLVSESDVKLIQIMNKKYPYVYDTDKIKLIPEIVSKYNLLAVPVIDEEMQLLGTVVIDDIIDRLMD